MNLSLFFQAIPNVYLFKVAPPWLALRYLRMLGSLYYIINYKEKNLIKRNIMKVFKNDKEAEAISKKTLEGIFTHYSEKLIMAHRNYEKVKRELLHAMEYSGLDILDRAMEKGGVILVTAHFGAVEFLPLALALRGYPVTMIVRFQTKRLKESLMERADEVNVKLIDSESENVMYEAIHTMKNGRILLTQCDEFDAWKPNGKTMYAFGNKIHLDRSLDVISRRSGSTPLGSFMIRTDKGYRLSIIPYGEKKAIEHEGLSSVVLKTFEQHVMMFPDQWYQWKKFHKMGQELS